MKIQEVKSSAEKKVFRHCALKIYSDLPNWIRPLDQDIEAVFDQKKNKFFRHGECRRWILLDEKGECVGRIAAFYSNKTAKKDNDQATGGLGFFECLNKQNAANLLFDTAKSWLESKGMEAMDGPINFGERDRWWGLLIDGFEISPNYMCNYNPSYYQELFESYGFQVYFKQFTYGRKTYAPLSERLKAKADRIAADSNYSFKHIEKKHLDKYTEDFRTIYNLAWASHKGVAKLSSLQAKTIMKTIKPIMDEDILWFGYYKDEPIAFFISLPEVNQIFRKLDGNFNWLGKLRFLYYKWKNTCDKVIGTAFGIVPEHQGKGVEGAIIMAGAGVVQKEDYKYPNFEMNWIGDFNPRMLHLCEQIGGKIVKTHHTYRKLFDESKEFKRHPIIGKKRASKSEEKD